MLPAQGPPRPESPPSDIWNYCPLLEEVNLSISHVFLFEGISEIYSTPSAEKSSTWKTSSNVACHPVY